MTNHLGEKEYRTFAAWKRAVKAIDTNASIEGNHDIANSIIGEWDGTKGCIYGPAKATGIPRRNRWPIEKDANGNEDGEIGELNLPHAIASLGGDVYYFEEFDMRDATNVRVDVC